MSDCEAGAMDAHVAAVHRSASYTFTKTNVDTIELVTGLGVAGDVHQGVTVQHRSRVARDPTQPNLRQVHLIHGELHDELTAAGLALGRGTRLHLGRDAVVEVTGLRNPCAQLDGLQPGLLAAVLDRDAEGRLVRKAGIMGIVLAGGAVTTSDPIGVEAPTGPHHPLEPV